MYCHAATPWREGVERSTRAQDLILNMSIYPVGARHIRQLLGTMPAHEPRSASTCRRPRQNGMALYAVLSRCNALARGDRAFDACARPHSQHGHVPRRGTVHYNLLHDGSTSTRRHHGQNGMALVDVLSRCSALTRGDRAFDACARPHSQREQVPRRGTSRHNLQLFGTMAAHEPRSAST